MNIKQIGDKFSTEYFEQVRYFSDDYFLEADILIIDLESVINEINSETIIYSTTLVLKEKKLEEINNIISERRDQIYEYLSNGGNLFIICSMIMKSKFSILLLDNKIEIIDFDYLSTICLSSTDFFIKKQKGNSNTYVEKFRPFFSAFDTTYDFIFKKYKGNVIGTVAKSNQPIELEIKVGNGSIFLLQSLKTFADDINEYLNKQRKCKNAFIELDRQLKIKIVDVEAQIEAPEWINNYRFSDESTQLEKLKYLDNKQKVLEEQIRHQNDNLKYYAKLKRLIYSSGTDLEAIVEEIFVELGYKTHPTQKNRDDLILSYNEQVSVVEIKGVKGSAAEKYAAQLMKWVSTYQSENDVNPKGILIVNAFKDKPLKDRVEVTFPDQMLPYSKQQ